MAHDLRPQTDFDLPTFEPDREGPVVKMSLSDALRNKHERIVRRRYAKTPVREYLTELSDEGLREKYLRFYDEHPFFGQVCAGCKHHHHWVGGLNTHVSEMIGLALDIKDLYRGDFEGKVSKDDVIIACFLHDFAKVWTYEFITDDDRERHPERYKVEQTFKMSNNSAFAIVDSESKTLLELGKYGINPTERQWSAVIFAEGAFSSYMWDFGGPSRTGDTVNSRNPLTVLTHIADLYSSQILGGSIA